ncbi:MULTISPECIES: hypothetical protein [unclassified Streptomyces]|uniref:hypothetical protein n=1 Tax=unclassified Streptomyces TaxID=2593676 RepID=UPI0001B53EE2|nr:MULTISPECIES: hypothetical protein [unclassified Streptomyces]MYR26222.1 hypothetical protein [Streptomyces sp. SID4945]SCE98289.1 hypothetical protein GA0115257_10541 [Streptomyces sp. LcepLS]
MHLLLAGSLLIASALLLARALSVRRRGRWGAPAAAAPAPLAGIVVAAPGPLPPPGGPRHTDQARREAARVRAEAELRDRASELAALLAARGA